MHAQAFDLLGGCSRPSLATADKALIISYTPQ